MSKQARIDIPGLLYHVTARGIERKKIFCNDEDRKDFLQHLGKVVENNGAQDEG